MLHSRWHSFIWPLIFFVAIFAWGGASIHSPQTTASAEEIPLPTPTPTATPMSETIQTEPEQPTISGLSSTTNQLELKIEINSDDAGHYYTNCSYPTGVWANEVYVGYCGQSPRRPIVSGLRFDTSALTNIPLPQITNIYLALSVEGDGRYTNEMNPIAIRGHAVTNSPTFSPQNAPEHRYNANQLTTASVEWPMLPWDSSLPISPYDSSLRLVQTPSLLPVFQEMITSGWLPSQPLTFILHPTGPTPPNSGSRERYSRRFIAKEHPYSQAEARLIIEYDTSCTPDPEDPLSLCVTDANGNPVTNLTTNEEGWPMLNNGDAGQIANPLHVTAHLHCPADGGNCVGTPAQLMVNSDNGQGRVYWDEAMMVDKPNDVVCQSQLANAYSFTELEANCSAPDGLHLSAGSSQELTFLVWVQPSATTSLEISAVWHNNIVQADTIMVEQAEIHPVVFLHGILGSMPPRNSNITQWPQDGTIPIGEAWLDPFTGSYNPLIENLLKMGYELDNTLYPTTYDWRQSNRISACWLADTLGRVQTNATAPYVKQVNGQIQADVIVHSMGGMVLRSYLQNMGHRQINGEVWSQPCTYQNDVHKAIFIATPHRGFPITYNTRENLTWEDYLSTEVDPMSDGLPFIPLATLMDNLVWPFFIHKQYAPNILEACYTSGIPLINLRTGITCPTQALHAMSQSSATQAGRYRGINSLLEMLPDANVPEPYLYSGSTAYPYARTTNPLLDGSNGLNSATSIQTLLGHVPAERIYTIYSNDVETTTGYEVTAPPPLAPSYTLCRLVHGSFPTCAWSQTVPATQFWRNGSIVSETAIVNGDDLIPEYSTNLASDWEETITPLIPLGNNNALASNEGGHKRVASSETTQNAIAAILTGFASPADTVPFSPASTKFVINTPYVSPFFLGSNLNTMLTFVVFSPVDVLLTDPQGRRIGYDPITGELVNEIPHAFYSGNGTDMEFFILPPQEGAYEVTTIGTDNGAYGYAFYSITGGEANLLAAHSGEAVVGQINTATISYTQTVETVFLSDTEADGPWLAENGWGATPELGDAAPPAWSSGAVTTTIVGQPIILTLTTPLDLTIARQARLWFNSQAGFGVHAQAWVELSPDEGLTWQRLGSVQGGGTDWERVSYDLTPFTYPNTPPILLRFRFLPSHAAEVWLVDDIHVEGLQTPTQFVPPFQDGFEGWNRWQVTGNWAHITDTVRSGFHSWQSALPASQLRLAGTIPLTQTITPELSFWHWAENDTVGVVQLSMDEGISWTPLYTTTTGTNGWQEVTVPLSSFVPHAIQLRFDHVAGNLWTIDDVAVLDKPLSPLYGLPFATDFEQEEPRWQGLGGWQPITSTAHSDTTSWHSITPNSALRLLGQVDLTTATQPLLSFWHRFELPAGSLGTVDISLDEGLTWTPIYTQTTSITEWTEVTVDLTAYVGHEVALAFFLRDVGTGEVLSEPTLEEVVSGTTTPTASNTLLLQFWLLPLIGMGAFGLLYYRPNWTKATGIGGVILLLTTLSITSCIAIGPSPNFDPEALDVQGGQLEIVIPAEHYISEAQVSPDGKWLYYGYRSSNTGEPSIALLNIVENVLYEDIANAGGTIWLDGNHLASPGQGSKASIWRLSDMVVIPKVVVDIESIEEGKALLEGATQLFFVRGSSRYSIESTDPDYPYTLRFSPSQLGCGGGRNVEAFAPCIEAMLSEGQTFTLAERRDVPNEPVYSPDGQYYVQVGRYPDDPTHSLGGRGDQLFETGSNELLVYGYRYGWNASFLGWAHDSSGAYILYRPRSPLGDLTRSQYPIRKYLVPGAEPRGLPSVISPAPTPRWLPTPDVTLPTPIPTEETSSFLPLWLFPLLMGMGGVALIRYRPQWVKTTTGSGVILLFVATSITSCIAIGPGPNFDPEALDVQGGNLEIVIPAEHYIMNAQVSPGGTWLAYAYRAQEENGRSSIYTAVLNIPENKLYDKLPGGASSPWLDDNHLSGGSVIWRLSDMVIIPKVVVDIESIEEGQALLAGATQLFFVQDSSRYSIQSTDPDYPYTIRFTPHQLQCELGYEGLIACVEAMLAPDQTYQLHGMRPDSAAQVEVYSPDGQYYIYKDSYNDLTGKSGRGTSLFRTGETERLTYGYRYEWRAEFLGWAHDSSGAYILYRPRSPLGDLTRSQYPIRKYLVPGAEPRGLPSVISPAPTPRWLPTPDVTLPASSHGEMQWVTLAQQNSSLGWVIDDITIAETSPPILTLWIENFPNMNTLQGDTGTNSSDSKVDDWEIELPPSNGPTLHWDIQHSQDCWGFGGWSPNGQLFTSMPTGQQPISEQVISPYYLTCFNQFGHTTVQVTPDPGYLVVVSDFRANNQAPLFMELQKPPITLQWGAAYSGGATCQASGAWSGTKSAWGSEQIWGLTVGKHRFTLSCPQETLSVLVVVNE